MSRLRVLRRCTSQEVVLARVRLADTFWSRFRGLQLAPRLPADSGLLFVTGREGIAHTSIHMFFMNFAIGVVWLDSRGEVVDKTLAKPWRPAYASRLPARYFLEANPDILDRITIGETLCFDEVAT